MTKYHISKNGKPSICRAKKSCPLGGESEHFESVEEAQKYADKINSEAVKTEKKDSRLKSTDIKRFLKEQNIDTKNIKIKTTETSMKVSLKDKNLDRKEIRKKLVDKYQNVSYDKNGIDILSGGNYHVIVSYDLDE